MGDHRASIKIEMEFHGVKDSCDMYINYFPGSDTVDQRVVDFFSDVYWRGMDKYNERMDKIYEKKNKRKVEIKEREQLEALKKKYDNK